MTIRRGSPSAGLELPVPQSRSWSFRERPAKLLPVFLHGGWRCGSTYVWSRFRQSLDTMCFYEPFHETLARCTAKRIGRETASSWNSRHPRLDRPYRAEYLHLLSLRRRGVRRYQDEFALAHYFPCPPQLTPQLRYLSGLLEHATRAGKCAVFGFSRSLGRLGAIKQGLGGYHVVVRRNPVQQWLSCRSYRVEEDSVYFELCHFLILALAPAQTTAGRYARSLGLPRPAPGSFREQFDFLHHTLSPWSEELSYRAFLGVSLLSHAIAGPEADLTIDVDRLGEEPEYRETVRSKIAACTGHRVDFRECRVGKHDTAAAPIDFQLVERDVVRLLRSCGEPFAVASGDPAPWRARCS